MPRQSFSHCCGDLQSSPVRLLWCWLRHPHVVRTVHGILVSASSCLLPVRMRRGCAAKAAAKEQDVPGGNDAPPLGPGGDQ